MKHKLANISENVSLWYLIVLFTLSYLWQLVIFLTGGVDSGLIPILMLFPAIVAIAFRIRTEEGFRNVGWGIRKWWYVFPAVFVPLAVVLGIALLFRWMNWAMLPEEFFVFQNGMLTHSRIGLMLGNQTQSIPFFVLNLVLSHIVFLVVGSVITLGEEFGWRGYLQEKHLRKYGLNWGLVVLGIVWGYWHLPLVLMGWTFPNHPILGALLLFPISTVFSGMFIGWIYMRSRSIWMPSLAHAAINLFSQLLFQMNVRTDELFLQLVFIAAWGVIAVVCLINLNQKHPILWQGSDTTGSQQEPIRPL